MIIPRNLIRKLSVLILLLPAVAGSMAQTIFIEGSSNVFRKRIIRLSAYEDLLTRREVTLAAALIDENGFFSMQAGLRDTQQLCLSIGLRKFYFIGIPGMRYHCLAGNDSINPDESILPTTAQTLDISFTRLPDTDPNRIILSFDSIYSGFLAKHSATLLSSRARDLYDSLTGLTAGVYQANREDFTTQYLYYIMAGLEGMVHRWPDAVIYDKYLKNKPVLYYNPAYMEFFTGFFTAYLSSKSGSLQARDLLVPVNDLKDLSALTDSLGKDSLLRNERIREMVLIMGLGELYHNPEYKRENVRYLLDRICHQSKFPGHRVMAFNMISKLEHLAKGTAAPVFSLSDQTGREINLTDYRGKWVYLGFFTTWCESCLAELKAGSHYLDKYGEKLVMLNVCCDENEAVYHHFIRTHKFIRWPVMFLNDSFEIIHEYQVYSYPLYVLIDPEGNIYQYPALQAGSRITSVFDDILNH
ncbi:MAG TPA: redoxin domain-containing protein [Bacteroidales bacterium]|nr:redoxin domain-containing protein [Bacteroidales bacterium]HSA43483.1 redoxin domain-containing protein [Bacteroidales bacterium]